MELTRRELLAGAAGLAVACAGDRGLAPRGGGLARRGDFLVPADLTYLNSAYTHPMPAAAVASVQEYLGRRARPSVEPFDSSAIVRQVKAEYAALINATPGELAFIPNTSTGENLVVRGLGIPGAGGNVVTDGLHFDGAILHLQALQARGLDLRMAMPRQGRIALDDLDRLIDRNTRLVEVSLVAMYNGFEHDLAAVCELAHARGALVYADLVQGVGAVPIDVRASGVDFAAASSFKWLMGDFGLGFLYARGDLLGRVIERTAWGYHSAPDIATHFLPTDMPGPAPFSWVAGTDAASMFEVGSRATGALMALSASLPYLRGLGVDRVQAHRQPILDRLREGLSAIGFTPLTPDGSSSPIIAFAFEAGRPVDARLTAARINARVGPRYLRVSPSVFNDLDDAERLIDALG